MNQEMNKDLIQQVAFIFASTFRSALKDYITKEIEWDKKKAVSIDELCSIFGIGKSVMIEICRKKDSPAFKISQGKTSRWMCFPCDMLKYLQKSSVQYKS